MTVPPTEVRCFCGSGRLSRVGNRLAFGLRMNGKINLPLHGFVQEEMFSF